MINLFSKKHENTFSHKMMKKNKINEKKINSLRVIASLYNIKLSSEHFNFVLIFIFFFGFLAVSNLILIF